MGYFMALAGAGYEVEGVDIEPQPNYPFRFIKGDALDINPRKARRRYSAVVGSPPCLGYTTLAVRYPHIKHERLIPATRDLMEEIGLPYIIENVENAGKDLIDPVRLCGSSFGLRVRRHRLFELGGGLSIDNPPQCNHAWQDRHRPYRIHLSAQRRKERPEYTGIVPVHGTGQQLKNGNSEFHGSVAMGIDWMTKLELNQAIPPAYTYYLGRRLLKFLQQR